VISNVDVSVNLASCYLWSTACMLSDLWYILRSIQCQSNVWLH